MSQKNHPPNSYRPEGGLMSGIQIKRDAFHKFNKRFSGLCLFVSNTAQNSMIKFIYKINHFENDIRFMETIVKCAW